MIMNGIGKYTVLINTTHDKASTVTEKSNKSDYLQVYHLHGQNCDCDLIKPKTYFIHVFFAHN